MALARFLYPSYLATLIHDASYKYLTSIWIMLEPSQAWNAAWLPNIPSFLDSPKASEADSQSGVLRRFQENSCISRRYMWSITWSGALQDRSSADKIDSGIRDSSKRYVILGLAIVK